MRNIPRTKKTNIEINIGPNWHQRTVSKCTGAKESETVYARVHIYSSRTVTNVPEMGGISAARATVLTFGWITRIGFELAIFPSVSCTADDDANDNDNDDDTLPLQNNREESEPKFSVMHVVHLNEICVCSVGMTVGRGGGMKGQVRGGRKIGESGNLLMDVVVVGRCDATTERAHTVRLFRQSCPD